MGLFLHHLARIDAPVGKAPKEPSENGKSGSWKSRWKTRWKTVGKGEALIGCQYFSNTFPIPFPTPSIQSLTTISLTFSSFSLTTRAGALLIRTMNGDFAA